MDTQTFRSDIFYSVQNEDYQTELAVLKHLFHSEPQRVLMVASSGENALSVLADEGVHEVHAVDTNPAQIQLCELRRTAVKHLTRDEQLALLGSDGLTELAATRLALYARLRAHLPEASQRFWDARVDNEIAFGIHFSGRNDVLMREVQKSVHAAGLKPFEQTFTDDQRAAWIAAYKGIMTGTYFKNTFGLPTEEAALKLASLAERTAMCHLQALEKPDAAHNYFLTTALANTYALPTGEAGLPGYLQEHAQVALNAGGKIDRLQLRAGNVLEQAVALNRESGPFDLISISNIVEWMGQDQFGGLVAQLGQCLKPQGALLARSVSDNRMIVEGIAKHMRIDESLNQRLVSVERGPWFRNIAVGFAA